MSKAFHTVEPDSSIPTESSSHIDEQVDLQGSVEQGKKVTTEKEGTTKKLRWKFHKSEGWIWRRRFRSLP